MVTDVAVTVGRAAAVEAPGNSDRVDRLDPLPPAPLVSDLNAQSAKLWH